MSNTALSFAASSTVLAFASFFGVFLMLQRVSFKNSKTRPVATAVISFLLIGATAIFDTIRYGFGLDAIDNIEQVISTSNTIAFFISPPLFTLVLIRICWQTEWKFKVSLYTFLASCALYWFAKTIHALSFYSTLLITCLLMLAVITVIRAPFRHPSSTLFFFVAILSFAMSLLIISYLKTTVVFLRLDFFHYLTALGNLFLASGFFQLMRKGELHHKKSI